MPAPGSPLTLDDIARRCRLSKAAVSLALRNHPRVSVATQRRVQRVAAELGYQLNPFLSAQMSSLRTFGSRQPRANVAYLQYYDSAPNALFLQGVRQRCEALGCSCAVFRPLEENLSGRRLADILAARGIAGVVIGPLPQPGGTVDLPWSELAAVAVGYSLAKPALHRAGADMTSVMEVALEQLARRGYQRPGYVATLDSQPRMRFQPLSRFLVWQRYEASGAGIPPLVRPALREEEFRRWLERHQPDVVITSVAEVRAWIERTGRRIPADIGLCNANISRVPGEIAGVSEQLPTVGAAAVDLLLGELYHHERGIPAQPKLTLIQGRWHEAPTLRPASGAPGQREASRDTSPARGKVNTSTRRARTR